MKRNKSKLSLLKLVHQSNSSSSFEIVGVLR
jgi:hypothetical protein